MNDLITVITSLIIQFLLLLIAIDVLVVFVSLVSSMFNHDE